ncbi:MAG: excinuclease ABC subunit UvrA [Clostridiales bacterium]|nr:excinuclease ABC subunit UvrA [Eubacteriales bacterium]NLO15259.1 excinuclease ABC subunit UvrA [Clostridiales bacterium]
MQQSLIIKGARVHNLKNISLEIPRNQLVVFTGLSGSGKSSLAFDTIYAEGQRRYVESMSSYARQFLGQMEKPDVDAIEGLSPAISIDQKTTAHNPRSTVGTVTEIHDYLRLLYARVGIPHCPSCGKEIRQQTVDEMVSALMALPEDTKLMLMAPIVRNRKGEHAKLLEEARKDGFVRARIDGEIYDLDETPTLDKQKKHTIEIVVDRVSIRENLESRLTDSLETVLRRSGGIATVKIVDGDDMMFSQNYSCPDCGINIEELAPRMFSFNNPYGACPACNGLGKFLSVTPDLVFPDTTKSLNQGAITAMGWNSAGDSRSTSHMLFKGLSDYYKFSMDTPINQLPQKVVDMLLYGSGGTKIPITFESINGQGTYKITYEGIIPSMRRRYSETTSDSMKAAYEEYMREEVCSVCHGLRLKPEALAVTLGDMNIADYSNLNLVRAREFISHLSLSETKTMIAEGIIREINARLGFLCNVGLDYLTLSRAAASLSGGEAQRIRLATQIGSGLMGVLYILDEPSIGLHQRDNARLLETLRKLRNLGNTLIVVEHDEDTLRAADFIVDIGPGAGEKGGEVVAIGSVEDLMAAPRSVTGEYLSGKKAIPVPEVRRTPTGWLTVEGAAENNLKGITVRFPLGVLCCISGVSGSGKSSLVNEILYKALARDLNRARTYPGKYTAIKGLEQLDKIINIDQSPIGRTPRSNPATYTGLFDLIRKVYAQTNEAKTHGYSAGRFSFNVKGGRCEACAGDGLIKIEMHFMADLYVPCEVCKGKRYNRETLEVRYRGHSISDVLDMTVEEAVRVFENHPQIMRKLDTLMAVGLGYIRLGQSSTTLSGGEAQRVKLATELSRRATGKTIILLDEPTTGLHMDDVSRLIKVLQDLTDAGNTVLVIEHNLDVLKTADYVIDLGPEGGDRGGEIIAEGTPEVVAGKKESYTGQYLRKHGIIGKEVR